MALATVKIGKLRISARVMMPGFQARCRNGKVAGKVFKRELLEWDNGDKSDRVSIDGPGVVVFAPGQQHCNGLGY